MRPRSTTPNSGIPGGCEARGHRRYPAILSHRACDQRARCPSQPGDSGVQGQGAVSDPTNAETTAVASAVKLRSGAPVGGGRPSFCISGSTLGPLPIHLQLHRASTHAACDTPRFPTTAGLGGFDLPLLVPGKSACLRKTVICPGFTTSSEKVSDLTPGLSGGTSGVPFACLGRPPDFAVANLSSCIERYVILKC